MCFTKTGGITWFRQGIELIVEYEGKQDGVSGWHFQENYFSIIEMELHACNLEVGICWARTCVMGAH